MFFLEALRKGSPRQLGPDQRDWIAHNLHHFDYRTLVRCERSSLPTFLLRSPCPYGPRQPGGSPNGARAARSAIAAADRRRLCPQLYRRRSRRASRTRLPARPAVEAHRPQTRRALHSSIRRSCLIPARGRLGRPFLHPAPHGRISSSARPHRAHSAHPDPVRPSPSAARP